MKKFFTILLSLISIVAYTQTTVLIEGQTYTNSDSDWDGVEMPRESSNLITFRNNSITSINTSSYMLLAGTDSYDSRAHNVDNMTITGNKLDWNGTPGVQACHGIMAGYNLNYTIKYNYIDGPYYGIVHEGGYDDGEGMVNTGGGISYNIFRNCPTPVLTWGFENVNIYNNTFYYNLTASTNGLVRVGSSNGTDVPAPSGNVKIKNNIFYSRSDVRAIEIIDAASLTGFECDYNVYYWASTAGNVPRFRINGTSYTWAQWQALGYDAHSVVINPDFVDTINFAPSARLDYGIAITDYENGLTPSSSWVVDSAPDVIQQDDDWQVGATILPVPGDYFVAPWGDDDDPGTFEQPWLTWQYAFAQPSPGDTVYFRGGVYPATAGWEGIRTINSGTAGNNIFYSAYLGEEPILDCNDVVPAGDLSWGIYASPNYVHFYGLTVRNLWMYEDPDEPILWRMGGSYVTVENCKIYNSHGTGFEASSGSYEMRIINCDSWNHCDSLEIAAPGNDGYGFAYFNTSNPNGTVYFQGCRAWNCGDDGWVVFSIGYIEIDRCWSFLNGQLSGGGDGFKLGFSPASTVNEILRRKVTNSIAAYNRHTGFNTNDLNDYPVNYMQLYNNIAYRNYDFTNDYGPEARGFILYNTADIDAAELQRVLRNNISFGNTVNAGDVDFQLGSGALYTGSNNTWNSGFSVSAVDFVSLDSTGILGPRQADGSLPNLNFLKLKYTSNLINAGTNVGLPYVGTAPDLGPYEYGLSGFDIGGDHYVAPWGDNADPGTFDEPWATLQYAMSNAVAGDTIYLRGGIYAVTSAQAITSNPGLVGTELNPICFFNYPGEVPIIDGSTKSSQSHGITLYYSSWVEFRGIQVRNHAQFESGSFPSAFNLYYCTDLTFDQCVVSNIGGRGFAGRWCDRLTFINCDAYNLDNNLSASPGGDADGFFLSPSYHDFTGQHYFYGCRAWQCGDDGWDIENLGLTILENCWAFNNGFQKYADAGLGNGYKLTLSPGEDVSKLSRIVINSIAAYNRRSGFTTNDNGYGARWMHIYNNTSYANGLYGQDGYGFQVYNTGSSDAAEAYRIFRNNIAYANTTLNFRLATGAVCTQSNNSWNGTVTVTNADFISVDSTGLSGARQLDGSLPNLNFLKLAEFSDLIDAGVDVGFVYNGSAPDIGAYEFDTFIPVDNMEGWVFRGEYIIYDPVNNKYVYKH